EGFDLAAHWREQARSFLRSMLREEVSVRLSPAGMRLLRYAVEPYAARRAAEAAGEPDADGWVATTLPVESAEVAASELMRLGPEAEVLGPPELRERMAAAAARLAACTASRGRTEAPPRRCGRARGAGAARRRCSRSGRAARSRIRVPAQSCLRAIASPSSCLVIRDRPRTPRPAARSYSSFLLLPSTSTPPAVLPLPSRARGSPARASDGPLRSLGTQRSPRFSNLCLSAE